MDFTTFLLLFVANLAFAQPDYGRLDALLANHVTATGKVNYKALKTTSRAELDAVAADLTARPVEKNSTKNEQLAYWINIYNVFTIKLLTDNYPISSITKLDKGKPWDVKRIKIGAQTYSLNQIENEIIRPTFKDARVHFALNCGAKSCPPLWNKAFTASNVTEILEERTKKFVQSKSNQIAKNSLKISKIFDWYKADFGDAPQFLSKYSGQKIEKNAKIEYQDYDWSLNE